MFTVVTGFFDIGRGEWEYYTRKIDEYLKHFTNMLKLNVNMIIFVEQKFFQLVQTIRKTVNCKTTIITLSINDLYMYKYLERITDIQNDPLYSSGHPNIKAPEISQPLYNIVTCSKMDLVYQATQIDTESNYFIWLDAGYTHSTIDLSNLDWNPTTIFKNKNTLSVIAIQSQDLANDDPREFFLQYIDILIGGFIGGYRNTFKKVRNMYYELVLEMFEIGLKDDDQFYNTILAKRHPELFTVYSGGWYSAMFIT
jgi:protein YibB